MYYHDCRHCIDLLMQVINKRLIIAFPPSLGNSLVHIGANVNLPPTLTSLNRVKSWIYKGNRWRK